MIITYNPTRNIWRSCAEYLIAKAETEGKTDLTIVLSWLDAYEEENKEKSIIAIGLEDEISTRREIGSNELIDIDLLMIDIFGISEGDKLDLTYWVKDSLKNGFPYYEYVVNAPDINNLINAEVMTKTENGKVEIRSFVSNRNVRLGAEVDDRDKYRRAIAIQVQINN